MKKILWKLLAVVALAFFIPLAVPDLAPMAPFVLFGAALTAAKAIKKMDGDFTLRMKIKGSVKIYHGALVALDASGFLVPAATGSTLVVGVANLQVQGSDIEGLTGQALPAGLLTTGNVIDTTGLADGARGCVVERGIFKFKNKAGDLVVDPTHIMKDVYVEDDQTVRVTATGSIKAGVAIAVEADGVWVAVGVNYPYGRAA